MDDQRTQQLAFAEWAAEYTTDSTLDKLVRVMAVERMLEERYGPWHAPDKTGEPMYFSLAIDAKHARSWVARRIIDEQDWRTRFEALQHEQHGVALPTLREMANRQLAEFEKTGAVTTTGFGDAA